MDGYALQVWYNNIEKLKTNIVKNYYLRAYLQLIPKSNSLFTVNKNIIYMNAGVVSLCAEKLLIMIQNLF